MEPQAERRTTTQRRKTDKMCKVTEENIRALDALRTEVHQIQQAFWKRVYTGAFLLAISFAGAWWQLTSKLDNFEMTVDDVKSEHQTNKHVLKGEIDLLKAKVVAREDACRANHEHEERRWARIESIAESLHEAIEKDRERFDNFREEMAKRHAYHHGEEGVGAHDKKR